MRILRTSAAWRDAREPVSLAALVLLTLAVRVAAMLVLDQPLQSDSLSYFTMASNLASSGALVDDMGQRAFFSAGYPLLLATIFALFGASVGVALGVNLALAGATCWLLWRLVAALRGGLLARVIACGAYALWLPGIWNASLVLKENLSTPLLLATVWCALCIAECPRKRSIAGLAGLLWGAGLVTGGSTLLLCAAVAAALSIALRRSGMAVGSGAGLAFCAGAAVLLGPWLATTERMVGAPVLATNTGFNLYIGNNPAATGRFVGIDETPAGENWETRREALGEAAASDWLADLAREHIAEQPGRTATLALRKLTLFWAPNLPDADENSTSPTIALLRGVEIAQYGLILIFGAAGLANRRLIGSDARWILLAAIAGFWLIHGTTYIIVRYRDPIIPLLITVAAMQAGVWLSRARAAGGTLRAA